MPPDKALREVLTAAQVLCGSQLGRGFSPSAETEAIRGHVPDLGQQPLGAACFEASCFCQQGEASHSEAILLLHQTLSSLLHFQTRPAQRQH